MTQAVLVYGAWGAAAVLVVVGSLAVDRGRRRLAGLLAITGLALLLLGVLLTGAM